MKLIKPSAKITSRVDGEEILNQMNPLNEIWKKKNGIWIWLIKLNLYKHEKRTSNKPNLTPIR